MDWVESVWSDFRFALRGLRRMPAFTAVATITLALGIGATSAMFTLVDGILLRPLPYPDATQLVEVMQTYPEKDLDRWPLSQENTAMYRDRTHDFVAFAAYTRRAMTLAGDRPERVNAALVTADFLKVLGVAPAIGRAFLPEEDRPNTTQVAILSHRFWLSHFAGDPAVLGKTLDLDGQPLRVIGIMPEGFAFPRPDVNVWIPLGLDPTKRFGWFLTGIARLAPGLDARHAERETTALMWQWARGQGALFNVPALEPERTRMKTLVTPLRTAITGDTARPLAVLQGAVVLILLIAIANVATLLSSRAAARSREFGLRAALGATGGRVVRQLLTESIALAFLGGVLGSLLAVVGVRAFTHTAAVSLPRIDEVHIDGGVLAFTALATLGSGILFGLLPAVNSVRARITSGFSGMTREHASRSATRANSLLVSSQLALSVVLLISAGLVLKSFRRLIQIDLGFRPDGITAIALPLPPQAYSRQKTSVFSRTLIEQLRAIPGVTGAALSWTLPYSGGVTTDGYAIEGIAPAASGAESQTIQQAVTPGYFATLGIPLRHGRDFSIADDSGSLPVVVVDEAFAKRYWPTGDGIGKRMRLTGDSTWFTIIGVVGSVRDEDAAREPRPHTYFPLARTGGPRLTLAVRSASDPRAVIVAVRGVISRLEPAVPLDDIRALSTFIDHALDNRRLTEWLLSGFALLAATLAGVGIYGAMSLYVANRRREFGIRLAVGAEPQHLVRLVLGEAVALTGAGVGLGVAGAAVATRWIQSLLYDVSATDPAVYTALAVALGGVALVSCWVPARRAAKSDPLTIMRVDGS